VSLSEALHIIATIHTRDDPQMGFVINPYAGGDFNLWVYSREQYIAAWKIVREHLHMQTEPQQ
jgi:hypothetical protein